MGERGLRGNPPSGNGPRGHVALRHLKRPVVLGSFFLVGFIVGLVDLDRSRSSSVLTPSPPLNPAIEYFKSHEKKNQHPGPSVNSSLPREPEKVLEQKLVRWLSSDSGDEGVDEVVEGEVEGLLPDEGTWGPLTQLIVVTATYSRPFQAAYLVRMAAALRLVRPPLLWIVVEVGGQSEATARLLRRTGLMYRHLVTAESTGRWKDRGVAQRNFALEHIERHRLDGIVYLADDDNAYSSQLFEEIRKVQRIGVLPLALLVEGAMHTALEGPVCEGGRVVGWHTTQQSAKLRKFHLDFASMAFNSSLLWTPPERPNPRRGGPIRVRDNVKEGFQETTFLEQLVVDEDDLEGLAQDCRRILVWHQHTEAAPGTQHPPFWMLPLELRATVSASTGEGS